VSDLWGHFHNYQSHKGLELGYVPHSTPNK
jgi:hypothetical protein